MNNKMVTTEQPEFQIQNKNNPILQCSGLTKIYREGKITTEVLNNLTFQVQTSETVAIVGASGSGKSTLLHLLGGLDQPTHGVIKVRGQDLNLLNEAEKSVFRNRHLGFVYQFHHLLPEFTLLENVAMPLLLRNVAPNTAIAEAQKLIQLVGLSHRVDHKISELSGGERQRTAVARAVITRPACLLADEPTGNLDKKTANQVFDLLLELNQTWQISLVIVTHDLHLADRLNRVVHLEDGRIMT